MSTITKIKGVIDNPNLPVITPEGLVNPIYGKFVNSLSEQDYTLTPAQSEAVKAFTNVIADNELAEYIQTIFPFIGSQSNPNGAKVPLFGDALFDFPSNFDGFSYENGVINGITKCPAIGTLQLSDVQYADDFVGAAYSFIKSQGKGSNNRLFQFGTQFQVRYQDKFGIYCRVSSGFSTLYAGDAFDKENITGHICLSGLFGDDKYVRCAIIGDDVSAAGGGKEASIAISSADMSNTLSANTWDVVSRLNCIVFFKKMMTKEQLTTFMTALDTFMTSLGRDD